MKTKSDFQGYTKEDFGKFLGLLTSENYNFRCFTSDDELTRIFYIDNTLYQLSYNNCYDSLVVGEELYRNTKYTLSIYTLEDVKKEFSSLVDSCSGYSQERSESFPPFEVIKYFRVVCKIMDAEIKPPSFMDDIPYFTSL